MNAPAFLRYRLLPATCCLMAALLVGCTGPREQKVGVPYDRPFPLGQVTDAHWETQQSNAEAFDFIFYDHEFVGNTAKLNPSGRKHLVQVALRMPHVPYPVTIEETEDDTNPRLDQDRRQTIIGHLTQIGVPLVEDRVSIGPAYGNGITAIEGEGAYYSTINGTFGNGGGVGRRFGGRGGTFR